MRIPALFLAFGLALTGCTSGDDDGLQQDPGSDEAPVLACSADADAAVEVTGEQGEQPSVSVPDGAPPCDLVTTDLVEGSGAEAVAGAALQVHYVGVSWSTKGTFDASWRRGQPISIVLGTGGVIAGWDQGLLGMKQGGRRLLVIPSDLGYGEQGQGTIQPGETLVFVVDLIGVTMALSCADQDVALRAEPDAIVVGVRGARDAKPDITVPRDDPPCELQVVDVRRGSGEVARDGMRLRMHYVGIGWSTRRQFDASWDRGDAFTFELGTGGVIQGWDQGIAGMRVGGRRLLVIPHELGYGQQGAGADIPPFETLVFVVDLLEADEG